PAGTALAADTFSAAADPSTAGTADKPMAEKVTLDAQIASDVAGTPHDVVTSLVFSLPAEFKDNLANFGVCPRETVHAAATGGASPTPASTPTTTTKKKRKVRLPCKRYRGRPHHRHCVAYRHGKKYHLPPRAARAQAAQNSMVSAFESTGCAGGSWPFQAKI